MATPEETRDRIKEMRDRIFKEPDKDSVNKAVKETPQKKELADKKQALKKIELSIFQLEESFEKVQSIYEKKIYANQHYAQLLSSIFCKRM